MGAYLSEPVTIKHVEIPCESNTDKLIYACCSLQGWRRHQEDAHIRPQLLNNSVQILGVYDGHGGAEVARFVESNLIKVLTEESHFKKKDYKKALQQAYLKIDSLIVTKKGQQELESLETQAYIDEEADAKLMKEMNETKESTDNSSSRTEAKYSDVIYKTISNGSENACGNKEKPHKNVKGDSKTSKKNNSVSIENKDLKEPISSSLDEKIRLLLEKRFGAEEVTPDETKSTKKTKEEEEEKEKEKAESEKCDEEIDSSLNIDNIKHGLHSGCTATTCLIIDNKNIICGNAGDSRCILSRNRKAFELSNDHNPDVQSEIDRIIKAGGTISEDGRVEGNLNLSRALGDLMYKRNDKLEPHEQMISGHPEIIDTKIQPGDEYLIIGCDGIFNVLTNQEVVDFVHAGVASNHSLGEIAANMCDRCMSTDADGDGTGCDNETVIILKLDHSNVDDSGKTSSSVGSSSSIGNGKKRSSDGNKTLLNDAKKKHKHYPA